jgi:hypothetical protein
MAQRKTNPAYVRAAIYGALFIAIIAYLIWRGGC